MTYFEKLIALSQKNTLDMFEAERIARKYRRFEKRCNERSKRAQIDSARRAKRWERSFAFSD